MMPTVGFLVFDGFQVLGLGTMSTFEIANRVIGRPAYAVHVVSEHGGPVRTSLGFTVETEPLAGRFHDTTITAGTLDPGPAPPAVLDHLRAAVGASRRVASICTGAYVLAEAGILDGRKATTHWAHARALQRLYPRVTVLEERIHSVDGNVWTSAGMSAGIDLALALVEDDFGQDLAKATARKMVLYLRRSGGQSQYSALLELEPRSDRIRRALVHAKEHLTNPLTVEELAEAARLGPRQFSRVFRQETGRSPAKAVEHLRLEQARMLLDEGRRSMDEIARATGFADRERMRRAFVRQFGQPPQTLRRAADAERGTGG